MRLHNYVHSHCCAPPPHPPHPRPPAPPLHCTLSPRSSAMIVTALQETALQTVTMPKSNLPSSKAPFMDKQGIFIRKQRHSHKRAMRSNATESTCTPHTVNICTPYLKSRRMTEGFHHSYVPAKIHHPRFENHVDQDRQKVISTYKREQISVKPVPSSPEARGRHTVRNNLLRILNAKSTHRVDLRSRGHDQGSKR